MVLELVSPLCCKSILNLEGMKIWVSLIKLTSV